MKTKNWRKWLLIAVGLILCAGIGAVAGFVIYQKIFNTSSQSLDKAIHKYISEYQVVEEKSDGTYVVSLEAPDISQALLELAGKQDADKITEKAIIKAIQDRKNDKKQYTIEVQQLDEEHIYEAFQQQVTYELLIEGLKQAEGAERGNES